MSDVTRILSAIKAGDPQAADALLPLVYDELRRLAAARLARENPGQTLEATALVHEAYLRLVDQVHPQQFASRGHFFAAAAEAMRRILVERARQKLGPKRGGHLVRLDLDDLGDLIDSTAEKILAVSDALGRLAVESQEAAELVKLRYFGGMTQQEAADALGISRSSADRLWVYAKAALYCELEDVRR
jgi:RNA polymerase sigma factor (TIGR02999 family)